MVPKIKLSFVAQNWTFAKVLVFVERLQVHCFMTFIRCWWTCWGRAWWEARRARPRSPQLSKHITKVNQGKFFSFSIYPSDSTVSEDAMMEPRAVATLALAVRRSNHSARSCSQIRLEIIHTRLGFMQKGSNKGKTLRCNPSCPSYLLPLSSFLGLRSFFHVSRLLFNVLLANKKLA